MDVSIQDYVSRYARVQPSSLAVVDGERRTTYGELERAANRLAHRLRCVGVGRRERVGVHLPRSTELLVAELAVLKCGGVYVPMDPAYPREHVAMMLSRTRTATVVAGPGGLGLPFAGTVLVDTEGTDGPPGEEPLVGVGSEEGDERDPALAVFTSGTTGDPKAVELSHAALLRLFDGSWIPVGAGDVVAQTAHACFDLAALETWLALTNGLPLVIVPVDVLLSPDLMATLVRRERITLMMINTGLFHEVAGVDPGAFAGVRSLMVGGDVLSPALTRAVLAASQPTFMINAYGPAEGGVVATSYDCSALPPTARTVPIGSPVTGTCLHILDEGHRPVAPGAIGDLYVGGEALAAGYLYRDDLTARRFLPDPEHPGVRMYDTGDRARRLNGDTLEFCGRRDQQVKIRGFRVEPGSAEAVLRCHPAVREAGVVVAGTGSDRRLIAYLELFEQVEIGSKELLAYLRDKLPAHTVPSGLVRVERLPLTVRGKLDRAALAQLPATTRW